MIDYTQVTITLYWIWTLLYLLASGNLCSKAK